MTAADEIWRVEVTSEHFGFCGYGRTEEEAIEAIGRAMQAHGRQYGLDDQWSDYLLDGFATERLALGQGYRDGAAIG